MQYYKVRSLAISLAIVLVLTRSQSNGFTIRRQDLQDSSSDLDTGASSLLEVKYDLKSPSEVKTHDIRHIKSKTDTDVIAISDTSEGDTANVNQVELTEPVSTTTQADHSVIVEELNELNEESTATGVNLTTNAIENNQVRNESNALIFDNKSTISENISNILDNEFTSPIIIESSTQNIDQSDTSTTEFTSTSFANILSSDTTKIEVLNGDIVTSTVYSNVSDTTTQTLINSDIQQTITEAYASSTENINDLTPAIESSRARNQNEVAYSERAKYKESTTDTSQTTLQSTSNKNYDKVTGSTEKINDFILEIDTSLTNNENEVTYFGTDKYKETTTDTSQITSELPSSNSGVEISTELNTVTDPLSSTAPTTSDIDSAISKYITKTGQIATIEIGSGAAENYLENNSPVITELQTEVNSNPETFKDKTITTTLPSWKNYKVINRKRPTTSIEETTSSDLEMTKSETARFSLERVLNNTPIPSLVELKNNLLNSHDYSFKLINTTATIKTNDGTAPALATLSPTEQISAGVETSGQSIREGEIQTPKLEIVSSKRAGYLDNKGPTTIPPQLPMVIYEDKEVSNDTENFATLYESEINDGDIGEQDSSNTTSVDSQNQLAEDAKEEELLMEKTLSENNLLREVAHQRDLPRTVLGDSHPPQNDNATTPEIYIEDTLSVKPISHDKKINNSIYVTSSLNYKPLKKLEVQHPKQFIRDPDDNSWRNESISSLGIVFKPKNASKSFTEVLKNKTTELNNLVEKSGKNNVPDLRVRLEKIAEVRKKKKRINKNGDTVYSDYEENSGENINFSKEDITSTTTSSLNSEFTSTTPLTPTKIENEITVNDLMKMTLYDDKVTTTEKLKKLYNLADYYDVTDDYDADYVTLSKIDLKKFTVPVKVATRPPDTYATRPAELTHTKPMRVTYMPDRQPTIQYFPPTKKVTTPSTPKISVNEYDERFQDKMNFYKDVPKSNTFATASPIHTTKMEHPNILTPKPMYTPSYQDGKVEKNLYLTTRPHMTEPQIQGGFVPNDGTFNRASYVIKHYKDFINDVAKAEDEKMTDYLPYTENPIRGVTISDINNLSVQKEIKPSEDYDYDTNFRKDIMNRFVDNFNQNSERFKVDFPILYNNSVVHRKGEPNGKVLASSSAFMKRLYETANPRSQFLLNVKPCNVNCESLTVDLAPAYELHYYVPEQEEKEEIETRSNTLPYRPYRL